MRISVWAAIRAFPIAVGLPVILLAAQIKPDDAMSNLSAWAARLHLGEVIGPNFPIADSTVTKLAIVILIVYAILIWPSPQLRSWWDGRREAGWKSPADAIEIFTDAAIKLERDEAIARLSRYVETVNECYVSIADQQQFLDLAGNAKAPEGEPIARKFKLRKSALDGQKIEERAAREAWEKLRVDICKNLALGRLVSKGVPAPYEPGKQEQVIPPHEWRVLALDSVKETAIDRLSGAVRYVGVVIGRR